MKDETVYLQHIIDANKLIVKYISGGKDVFLSDDMIRNATIKVLANIAESASLLTDETKNSYPQVSWNKVKSFRNLLVHDYLGDTNYDLIWDITKNDLPKLVETAQKILKQKYKLEI